MVGLLLETLREPDLAAAPPWPAPPRQDVPVVALTVGGSAAGRAMVAAHSGALAGDDGAWEALFDAHGVMRVRRPRRDGRHPRALRRRPAGRSTPPTRAGIATVHDSGAERALVVDVAASLGVSRSPPSAPAPRNGLAGLLDPGLWPRQPARRLGHRGRHRSALRRDACRRWPTTTRLQAVALAVDLVAEYDGDAPTRRRPGGGRATTDQAGGGPFQPGQRDRRPAAADEVRRRRGARPRGHPVRAARPAPSPRVRRTAATVRPGRPGRNRVRATGPAVAPTAGRRDRSEGTEAFALLADYGIPVVGAVRSARSAGGRGGGRGASATRWCSRPTSRRSPTSPTSAASVLGVRTPTAWSTAYDDLAAASVRGCWCSATAPDGRGARPRHSCATPTSGRWWWWGRGRAGGGAGRPRRAPPAARRGPGPRHHRAPCDARPSSTASGAAARRTVDAVARSRGRPLAAGDSSSVPPRRPRHQPAAVRAGGCLALDVARRTCSDSER